ncbi:MAG: hypothetical protein KAS16_01460 [Thermoplasmata archaeon]|nr:hypothetical protein [Thermoplasmata archaeon]
MIVIGIADRDNNCNVAYPLSEYPLPNNDRISSPKIIIIIISGMSSVKEKAIELLRSVKNFPSFLDPSAKSEVATDKDAFDIIPDIARAMKK